MSVKEKPLTARQRSGSKISETMATIVPTGRLVGVAALARDPGEPGHDGSRILATSRPVALSSPRCRSAHEESPIIPHDQAFLTEPTRSTGSFRNAAHPVHATGLAMSLHRARHVPAHGALRSSRYRAADFTGQRAKTDKTIPNATDN